jgi:hypothetical protein
MRRFCSTFGLSVLVVGVFLTGGARAGTLFDQTNLIGLPTVAPPVQYTFTAATAQALTVTLTDLKQPAAFQSVEIAVTLGDTLVGSATVDATGTAVVAVPAASGNYGLRVAGLPDATQGIGTFGVCVAPASTNTACIASDSFSNSIITPTTASTTASSSLTANFTSTVAGTYTVTITDDQFPAALQMLSGGISNGSTPVNTTPFALGTNTITLSAGTVYTLILGAVADSTTSAGLYGVHIVDPNSNAVFDRTTPVGKLPAATLVNNPSAQALNVALTDFAYPAALSNLGVAITVGSVDLGQLTAAGTLSNIEAPSGQLFVWQYAVAASEGVYSLDITGPAASGSTTGATVYSNVEAVNPTGTASTGTYAFAVTLPSAGNYQLTATDFQFPSSLQTLSATVAQNGAVLTENSTGVFTAAAGVAIVLVTAEPPQSGNGVFDVNVSDTNTPATTYLDQTQAVGGTFTTQPITVTTSTAGGYTVTLADLGFPTPLPDFANLAVVVSQGSTVLGKIYGSGNFPVSVTAGTYELTFVATPGTSNYGLYSINISSAAAPTVTFTASASSVTTDQPVELTWSTTNATACTAAGASSWTGTEPLTGTASVVVSTDLTLTLTCTGPGGSTTQTVNVTATAAASSGHGGGGSFDVLWLTGMAALFGAGKLRRRPRRDLDRLPA